MCSIICGISQGSILGSLLFLIYDNDLHKASSILKPVMFADDKNMFLSNKDIKKLFNDINFELQKMSIWFKTNKLSLNLTKKKWTLFQSQKKKRLIANDLAILYIDNFEIIRESVTKFLAVYIEENLTWKYHIEHVCNKVFKSIGIMYKTRNIFSKRIMKQLYFLFIHRYLNYANITWTSTNKSNLISFCRQQKHAIRIIYDKDRFAHRKPLFKHAKLLTVYEIDLFQILSLIF